MARCLRNVEIRSVDAYSYTIRTARRHQSAAVSFLGATSPHSHAPNPACSGVISQVLRHAANTATAKITVTPIVNAIYPPGRSSPVAASTVPPTSGINVPEAVEMNRRTVDSVVRSLKSAVISPGKGL